MKKTIALITALGLTCLGSSALATPEEDKDVWQGYFQKRFPDVPKHDFTNGVYAIDPVGRENWEAIEEFPPYETALSAGEEICSNPTDCHGETCCETAREFDLTGTVIEVVDGQTISVKISAQDLTRIAMADGARIARVWGLNDHMPVY